MSRRDKYEHLTDMTRKAVEECIQEAGADGFTRDDFMEKVAPKIDQVGGAKEDLERYGKVKLRKMIYDRLRKIEKKFLNVPSLHGELADPNLKVFYPIKQPDGSSVFKLLVQLNQDEVRQVRERMEKKRDGLKEHEMALRSLRRQLLKAGGDKNPYMTVAEAQDQLLAMHERDKGDPS
ncbi:MAG: hypothetical protein AAF607_15890 [Pseudomonadota bacterium]